MTDLDFIINHLGEDRESYFHSIAPPIFQTSNFHFPTVEDFRREIQDEFSHHIYTRGNNPTVEILRKKLAALEGAEEALVFSSGMGAISASVLAFVKKGDHIVCVQSPYSWTHRLLTEYLPRFGVETTFVDGRDFNNIESAIRDNTRILYLESPNTMWFELQDLEACGKLASSRKIISIIDNSCCSPLLQNPHRFGIDLVTHTISKYISGHSDLLAGAVCGAREHIVRIFQSEFMNTGAIISPLEAALILRGLRTLPIRIARINETGKQVATYLDQHPKVERVFHVDANGYAQKDLATKQMKGQGGLFSVLLKTNSSLMIEKFADSLERFMLAVSWGGYESLVLPACAFPDTSLPQNLVRFYTGLESPDNLIKDLDRAIALLN